MNILLNRSYMTEALHAVDKIIEVCKRIENDRSLTSVFDALIREVAELKEEILNHINDKPPGPDGIQGEVVDILLCAVDILYQYNPSISKDYISHIVTKKLEKWERLYADKVYNTPEAVV